MSTDSYRKCAKCGTTPIQDGTMSFHRFPKPGKNNILRARAWATYCWPEEEWLSIDELTKLFKKNKVLCNRHFEDDCFTDSSKKNLGRFSVPGEKSFVTNLMESLRKDIHLMRQNDEAPQNLPEQSKHLVKSLRKDMDLVQQNDEGPPNLPEQSELHIAKHPEHCSKTRPSQTEISHKSSLDTYKPMPGTSQNVQISETSGKPTTTKKRKSILRPLAINKISELTPREKKLYEICTSRIKEINRLRKQLKSKSKTDNIQKICEDDNVKKLHEMNLTNSFIILLQNQLNNCKRKQKGRRYTIEHKIMALTLYKKSPACYRLLRRMIGLPSQSTLKKLLNRIPLRTGINPQIFEGLKQMAETQLDNENICILSFDEMAIRKHLDYNVKLDCIEGFQDHGNHGRDHQIASNALVFMLAGIRKKWKQPIAFYFSGKSVTSDRLSVIIKEILNNCFEVGLNVVATVCDLSRVNIKTLDILGSSKEEPYFTWKGHEITTILDPPHLLKCTRNLFMKYNIECSTNLQTDGKVVKGVAKWSHVKQFHELDKNNPNFVFAPALTEQHLNPNSKQKMRVKLAAQVFSHKVTAGILAKIASNELPTEAHATATLLNKFDELFDALNADTPDLRAGKKYATNITKKSPHLKLFLEMKKFISDMNLVGSNSPPPSQVGWVRTINAVERLWRILIKKNITSLSTRRLNQDPLENCFGCIRYHCGSNDNPTVGQFVSGIKTAIINNLKHQSSKKNCEDDTAVLCNNLKSFLLPDCLEERNSEDGDERLDLESVIADAIETVEQASPEAQACTYVCGFIFKKLKRGQCDACKKAFLTTEATQIHLFTQLKEYDTFRNSLQYASREFVQCVEICAFAIKNILDTSAWQINIKKYSTSTLSQVDFDFLNKCSKHANVNKVQIMNSVFYICLKRQLVLKNRAFSEEERKKALDRKMRILQHK